MELFDMHSHILPGIDDGAASVEDSVALINCLKNQGVKNICLTPHFYTNEISLEDFVDKRSQSVNKLIPNLPDDIKVVVGAEVYVTKYLFGNNDLTDITYGNSKYILTEFGYNSRFSEHTMEYFSKLIDDHGLIPVLPHVERYATLMDNTSVISELKDMGVLIQTNISNYTKKASLLRRKKMIKLINNGLIDIIGSDAHSFKHNSPELYKEAVDFIASKCGSQTLNSMMKKSEEIFNSRQLSKDC